MKHLFLTTMSSLLFCLFPVSSYGMNLTNSAGTVAAAKNTARASNAARYKSPEAAVKAFIAAWRRKNRAAMLKVAEKDVVNGIGNLIKGSTLRSCEANTEAARKTYNCTVQAGDDDLTAVYLEVVLTRVGYRIMEIGYAAAH